MKKITFLIILLIALIVGGGIVYFRFPEYIPFIPPPTITPISVLREAISTPKAVPTTPATPAAARSIPVPVNIPTLDVVKDLVKSSIPATLVLNNLWSSDILLDFSGLTVTINPGKSETKQFPPGQYTYTASSSNCGSPQTSSILLEANQTYSIDFYCSSNGVFPEQQEICDAYFVVFNNSTLTISLSIGNHVYQVPPGITTIRLAPGVYTYSASAPGVMGTIPKTISVGSGDRLSVSFTIN
jgi:hypothetical protein